MVDFKHNTRSNNHKKGTRRKKSYDRLASMGSASMNIINKLFTPIDATNRFLNLALQTVEEDSQSRQFLLESKMGLRRMSSLLKRLNTYAKKMEKEFDAISRKR
jgi:hypothetical protein